MTSNDHAVLERLRQEMAEHCLQFDGSDPWQRATLRKRKSSHRKRKELSDKGVES
jgi:hypothetical protein